jgi:hypothetical protein
MDTWEHFFRHKSRRRSRSRPLERAAKRGVLVIFFGSIAAAAYMLAAGLPR